MCISWRHQRRSCLPCCTMCSAFPYRYFKSKSKLIPMTTGRQWKRQGPACNLSLVSYVGICCVIPAALETASSISSILSPRRAVFGRPPLGADRWSTFFRCYQSSGSVSAAAQLFQSIDLECLAAGRQRCIWSRWRQASSTHHVKHSS